KDPTAAERQRRCRDRKRKTVTPTVTPVTVTRDAVTPVTPVTTEGETIIVAEQQQISVYYNDAGDLVLKQADWPNEDSFIVVARGNIFEFIDALTDVAGVPSLRG